MSLENPNKNNIENNEAQNIPQEKLEQKEISQEDFVSWVDQKEKSFKEETQDELSKLNSVGLDEQTFEQVKTETNINDDLSNIDSEMSQVVLATKEQINNKPETQVEIKKEFIDEIINSENVRYKSEEAITRAKRIDTDFAPTKAEKIFNKYKLQEKNIDYIGHNPNVVIGDWLDEGMGGYYRQQPALVSRKNDFIEVTSKANPDQITQILQHEYNHMFTQGEGNFSKKYQEYIRGIFFSEEELKNISQSEGNEILSKEPFPGGGPVYQYLTSPAEINAYLGTNLRHDLFRSGIIKNFYDKVDHNVIEQVMTVKDSNGNREKTPIYKTYLSMIKDKERLADWLNNYAI